MSAITSRKSRYRPRVPRADDPRVIRSRAAVIEAARTLFLRNGYVGTSMEQIAIQAGLTKRTIYNIYPDKEALFEQIVGDVITYAESFASSLREEFGVEISKAKLRHTLDRLSQRLALAILRPEVVALRRLLICEARSFPALSKEYYDRAPGQVIDALSFGFHRLDEAGVLHVQDARCAAIQFAYLVVGESLDRAILTGTVPLKRQMMDGARDGVETFLARYGAVPRSRRGGRK